LVKSYHWIQDIETAISQASGGSTRRRISTGVNEMTTTRRTVLAAAGASLAFPHVAEAANGRAPLADTVAELIRSSEDGNAALMRGDIGTYTKLVPLTDDFLLMSPFGGEPTLSPDYTPERLAEIGRFFRNGTFSQEVLRTYAVDDMVVLTTIERADVEVGGLPAQDWALRVTLVYRRDEDGAWRLVHRHADPLAHGINLDQAAALGRGEGA
jgi:ketosteroid isomerase-like protein